LAFRENKKRKIVKRYELRSFWSMSKRPFGKPKS
jgi:hypothetical protein